MVKGTRLITALECDDRIGSPSSRPVLPEWGVFRAGRHHEHRVALSVLGAAHCSSTSTLKRRIPGVGSWEV